jgi:signal transduction histidine kinase
MSHLVGPRGPDHRGMAETFFERLYGRMGWRMLIAVTFAVGVAVCAVVLLLYTGGAALYFSLSFGQFLQLSAVAGSGILVALAVGPILSRHEVATFRRWIEEGPSAVHPTRAWRTIVRLPLRWSTRTGVAGVLLVPPMVAIYLNSVRHLSLTGDLVASGAEISGMGLAWALCVLGLEFGARPMVKEVSLQLPTGDSPDIDGWSLRTRALIPLPFVALTAAILTGALVSTATTPTARMAIAIAGGLVTTLTLGFVLRMAVTAAVLRPIGDLVTAVARIGHGEVSQMIPLTSTDELAGLAQAVNQMQQGLGERDALRNRNAELDAALQASLDDLRRHADELQRSRARVVAAADQARRQVERDLHDGAQQQLVLMRLKLGILERDPERGDLLASLKDDVEQALAQLRDLAHGLYPAVLENEGLAPALIGAAKRAGVASTVDCEVAGRYPRPVEAAVYFCCLEALQNAAKHAGPQARATVELNECDGALRFAVTDTGAGFEPGSNRSGRGLQNMADRIGALGGRLELDSAPGRGTRVSGEVPLRDKVGVPSPQG